MKTVSTTSGQQVGEVIRARLLNRGAYRWYLGTIFGFLYQTFEVIYVWANPATTVGIKLLATALLVVFYLGYIVLPPLLWSQPAATRIVAIAVYWAATFVLLPFLGVFLVWIWPLIVAMITFSWLPIAATFTMTAGIIAAQVLVSAFDHFTIDDGVLFAPFVTVTVLISLFAITRQIQANANLRDAQATIASLAAAEERARLARDLHDVLGHSLTVVVVKSELAGRLVELDPQRAIAEMRDIEQLSRTALADLRAAVTSYQEMNLESELSAARTALEAAGIQAHFPLDGDAVDEDLRPLFCWVLREGVTNVIRHSSARQCWVELEPRQLRVRDDGVGATRDVDAAVRNASDRFGSGRVGNGLKGLTERAAEAGATLSAARVNGGFSLTVAKASR